MKKNVLALSITAALVGIGFAGGAQAIGLNKAAGLPITAGAGTSIKTSVDNIGQFLLVPYYTVQDGNNTMINIVNTDTTNGKAVKVRFRTAGNSDDVLDFQVFLSPGDVWNASVYKDPNTNQTRLYTSDNTCTKPLRGSTAQPAGYATGGQDYGTLNHVNFSTVRLDPALTGDALVNQTREGYVEIFNMADIPPTSGAGTATDLYHTILHKTNLKPGGFVDAVNGCQSDSFTALDTDPTLLQDAYDLGLSEPSSGLFANWIILNAPTAGAWSGAATALNAGTVDQFGTFSNADGALVYFPQTDDLIPNPPALGLTAAARVQQFTADPWLRDHAGDANPVLRTYDLPDFSIPYTNTALPVNQVMLTSRAISTNLVANEWLSIAGFADTDWVLSMPTRRYSVAMDYSTGLRTYTTLTTPYFNSTNTFVQGKQVCVSDMVPSYRDQEEQVPGTTPTGVIVSPQPPGQSTSKFNLCGEVSVLSFNNNDKAASGALVTAPSGTFGGTVARSTISTTDIGGNVWDAGWLNIATPGLGSGLPILGYEAIRAQNALADPAFGATLPHKTDRLVK